MEPVHVYVACSGDNAVDLLELDADSGTLRHLSRTSGIESVRALALDTRRGLLHAGGNSEPPVVSTFAIGPDGALEPRGHAPMVAPTAYLTLDTFGEWIFNASYHQSRLAFLPLTEDGAAADGTPVVREPGAQAHCVLPSPDGSFIYAASLGGDRIAWFARGGGAFTEAGAVDTPEGSGPRHLVFSASGDFLYALHEMSGEVAVYRRNTDDGGLQQVQRVASVPGELGLVPGRARVPGVPAPGPDAIWCSDLRLAAGGRYLFTTERSTSTVSAFEVDPQNGILAYLRTTETEQQPRGAGVDPSGRFLLVCGEKSHHLAAYRIDPEDGSLEETGRVGTGRGPMWIETRLP